MMFFTESAMLPSITVSTALLLRCLLSVDVIADQALYKKRMIKLKRR